MMRVESLVAQLVGCICWLTIQSAGAISEEDFNIRLWQGEDGLPHSIVQAITQARDGYIWVGTREGVARFDGNRFLKIQLLPSNPQPSVLCLTAAKDGSIWIGTEGAGVFQYFDGKVNRQAPNGQVDFTATEIEEDARGVVWIASTAGLLRYQQGKITRLTEFSSVLKSLCVDPEGDVWLIGAGQLTRMESPTNFVYAMKNGYLPGWARRICRDRAGVFWIGMGGDRGNGLMRVENGSATTFSKSTGPASIVQVIREDTSGRLWLGSRAGLSWFENGKFVDLGKTNDSSYQIYAIFEDHEHNLWVGSEEGLSRLTPRIFSSLARRNGLALNTVMSVCATRDGSVWISAWGGGLNRWQQGKLSLLRKSDGLSSDYIMAMCEAGDGSLWVGSDYGAALNQIKDGEITQYGRERGFAGAANSATISLCESPEGILWIGDIDGIQRWDGKKFTRVAIQNRSPRNKVNALCAGTNGVLWIGTDGGLNRLKNGVVENLAASDARLKASILSMYLDAAGALWIGTRDHGLLQWKEGATREFTSAQGLFSDSIYSILEDTFTNLWLNSGRGVFRVQKAQLEALAGAKGAEIVCVNYGKTDGIPSSGQYRDVTQPSACKSADGRLWFRTTQGVVAVDPRDLHANTLPPPVVIQEVMVDKQVLSTPAFGLPKGRQFVAPPGRGELEIHYEALSFRTPEKNKFRYRLEGVDLNWVDAGTRRVALYNNLRPGTYNFSVIACNNDGVWNTTGASLVFVLKPHLWQTWWFATVVSLAAVGLVGGSVRYVTRQRMQRKLERLQQQNAIEQERARIARDMHDELGAKLTRISYEGAIASRKLSNPAEAAQKIGRMSATARELVLSLDQIVWAVNPENDSLENLANYICRYASGFFSETPIRCEFAIPTELPPHRLSTEVRHNVFLAVKEILNNAAKHSGASQVVLAIEAGPKELQIRVSDDGRGMAAEEGGNGKSKRTGHGLTNLRERMASIQGRLEIRTDSTHGTEIGLIVPLPKIDEAVSSVYPTRKPTP